MEMPERVVLCPILAVSQALAQFLAHSKIPVKRKLCVVLGFTHYSLKH